MLNKNLKEAMWAVFRELGEEALSSSHYALAELSEYAPENWKDFLKEPDVKRYIAQEMQIIRDAELNRIAQQASTSRSVGQAQLVGALQKLNEQNANADGPVFIYSYVPLNENQKTSPFANDLSAKTYFDPELGIIIKDDE